MEDDFSKIDRNVLILLAISVPQLIRKHSKSDRHVQPSFASVAQKQRSTDNSRKNFSILAIFTIKPHIVR